MNDHDVLQSFVCHVQVHEAIPGAVLCCAWRLACVNARSACKALSANLKNECLSKVASLNLERAFIAITWKIVSHAEHWERLIKLSAFFDIFNANCRYYLGPAALSAVQMVRLPARLNENT